MSTTRSAEVVFCGILLLSPSEQVFAQPLLRESEPQPEAETETDPDVLRRQALARQKAELQEEQRMKQQQLLMQLRGEQMIEEQQEIQRRNRMMRYALFIAVAVIATTILIAFARSRVNQPDTPKR